MRSRYCFCVLCVVTALVLALMLLAPSGANAQAAAPATNISFINHVAPILKENCFACHDAKKRKGKLDMTTYENIRKGGDKDDPIVVGKPEESLIVDLITATGAKRMPPRDSGEALPEAKIAVIKQWIKEGAKLDAEIPPKADLVRELRLRWQPPAPPAVYRYPVNINSLAFTPDNKKLVVGGHHELTVWDVGTGNLEKRIYTRAERAKAMLFHPSGMLIVAGSRPGQEGDLRVYNINGGTPKMENGVAILDGVKDKGVLIGQLLESDDEVLCLAISPDGKKVASGGCDRIVNVFDVSAGFAAPKIEQKIENHADWVFGVSFAPDNKHLLTCSRDKTAKVWDLATKESVLTFPDHQNGVNGVTVKADSKIGYSVGDDAQLRTWNAQGDGKVIRNSGGSGGPIFKLVRHPSKPLLITCGADKIVRVWNEDNGAAVRALAGHTDYVYAVAVSPDGTLIAGGSWNGEVKIWKEADGMLVKSINASPGLQAAAAPAPKK